MNNVVDTKIIDRVRKLLALAADGSGASENEAAIAAQRAADLMAEHGLAMAVVTASGGEGERRVQEAAGQAFFNYQNELMAHIAKVCFCHVSVKTTRIQHNSADAEWQTRKVREGFELIGRESAVATARVMFEYLDATIRRLTKEAKPEVPKWYRRGMAERLGERLTEQHEQRLREQREEAERRNRETAARASHPSAAPSGNALVPVLADYAETEADLNTDMRSGLEPGTTSRQRHERERHLQDKARQMDDLQARGLSWDVAWYMVNLGMTEEAAIARDAADKEREAKAQPKTEAERRRESARAEREWAKYANEQRKENAKRSSSSWRSGRRDGENVGLNPQVSSDTKRRLS